METTVSQKSYAETQPAQHSSDELQDPPATPAEIKFDEAVRALIASGSKHSTLKRRLFQLVYEESKKLPPTRVVYCTSYGGFRFSKDFEDFQTARTENYIPDDLHCCRDSLSLHQDISDYGRFLCEKYPFVLDDIKTMRIWRLSELLKYVHQKNNSELEARFAPDLVTKAQAFVNEMTGDDGSWREDGLGSFPKGDRTFGVHGHENIDFAIFIELHPDFWMSHDSISNGLFAGLTVGQFALRFAHILLKDDFAKYHVAELDKEKDPAGVFEYIGLCGAGTSGSRLAIQEVPALIAYDIHEYDGQEKVQYHS